VLQLVSESEFDFDLVFQLQDLVDVVALLQLFAQQLYFCLVTLQLLGQLK